MDGLDVRQKMKLAPIAWNLVRVMLIVICCYQIALAFLDSMQAARMLQGADLKPYGQVHSEPDPDSVVKGLMRRGGDSAFGWLAGLGLLALLPYASVSKGLGRGQESPNKTSHSNRH